MKAISIHGDPSAPQLVWDEMPDITYSPDEVLVDVWAHGRQSGRSVSGT